MNRNEIKYLNFFEILLLCFERLLHKIKIDIHFKECYILTDLNKIEQDQSLPKYKNLSLLDFKEQCKYNPGWFNKKKIEDLEKAFSIDGNYAYGIYDNELLIAYGWISTKYFGITNKQLKIGDCHFWDDYTHPEYRGRNLHKNIIRIRYNEAKALNIKRVLSITRFFNKRSSIGFKKEGFNLSQRYCTFKVLNYKEKDTLKY